MNIGIIGAGSVGSTLGLAWARQGHKVAFGVRDPADAATRAKLKGEGDIGIVSNAEAAQRSDVIALCTPWGDTQAAIEACGNLAGKAVMDCTNPLKPDFSGLALGYTNSGAEQVAQWARGAQVFKAMNQIGANRMDHPKFKQGAPVMFVCGDGDKKAAIMGLVKELGFDTVDAGPLHIARLLEPFAMLWIHLALGQRMGRDIGFALLRE